MAPWREEASSPGWREPGQLEAPSSSSPERGWLRNSPSVPSVRQAWLSPAGRQRGRGAGLAPEGRRGGRERGGWLCEQRGEDRLIYGSRRWAPASAATAPGWGAPAVARTALRHSPPAWRGCAASPCLSLGEPPSCLGNPPFILGDSPPPWARGERQESKKIPTSQHGGGPLWLPCKGQR